MLRPEAREQDGRNHTATFLHEDIPGRELETHIYTLQVADTTRHGARHAGNRTV
jgi:hypothetical protein